MKLVGMFQYIDRSWNFILRWYRPFLARFFSIFGLLIAFYSLFFLLPRYMVTSLKSQYTEYLNENSSLLAQSRIFTFELLRVRSPIIPDRDRLVALIHTIARRQRSLPAPPDNMLPIIVRPFVPASTRALLSDTNASMRMLAERQAIFLEKQSSWLAELDSTPQGSMRPFLSSSSSISLLTEQTNILLQYRFWIQKLSESHF